MDPVPLAITPIMGLNNKSGVHAPKPESGGSRG